MPSGCSHPRSEERARGWEGVVVGDPLRGPLRPLGVPRLRHHRTRQQGLRLFLDTAGGQEFFSGAWGWFAVVVVQLVFNSVLGEELLFRGLLLPRMRGVFGRRSEEHTSELQSRQYLVCRLLLEKKKQSLVHLVTLLSYQPSTPCHLH